MLFAITQLTNLFDKIRKKLLKNQKSIVFYCTYEIDSICAVKMLAVK